jgi:hypothetical protein
LKFGADACHGVIGRRLFSAATSSAIAAAAADNRTRCLTAELAAAPQLAALIVAVRTQRLVESNVDIKHQQFLESTSARRQHVRVFEAKNENLTSSPTG